MVTILLLILLSFFSTDAFVLFIMQGLLVVGFFSLLNLFNLAISLMKNNSLSLILGQSIVQELLYSHSICLSLLSQWLISSSILVFSMYSVTPLFLLLSISVSGIKDSVYISSILSTSSA